VPTTDEDENSQASDDDDDGDSEVQEKSVAEVDSANDQLAVAKEDEEEASPKPTHSHPESSSSQSNVTQPAPPAVPAKSVDHDMQPPEIVEKGLESHAEETEGTTTATSSKKEKPSKEDGLYDLLTQTIEALKIT
jgi:hypothetical protein